MSKKIYLRGKYALGKFALVDDSDYEFLNQWKWRLTTYGYVVRSTCKRNKGKHIHDVIYLQREILGTPKGMETDHKDRNKLNNQRENLRICTHQQNEANKGISKRNTSGYKGISWDKKYKHWGVWFRTKNRSKVISFHKDKLEAAKAYDQAAKEKFGEFAKLNFI